MGYTEGIQGSYLCISQWECILSMNITAALWLENRQKSIYFTVEPASTGLLDTRNYASVVWLLYLPLICCNLLHLPSLHALLHVAVVLFLGLGHLLTVLL